MKLYIKYMVSLRCKMIVKEELKKLSIPFVIIDLGMAETEKDITPEQRELLKKNCLSQVWSFWKQKRVS